METDLKELLDKEAFKFGAKTRLTVGQIAPDLPSATDDSSIEDIGNYFSAVNIHENDTFKYSLYYQFVVKPKPKKNDKCMLPRRDPATGNIVLHEAFKQSCEVFADRGDSGSPVYIKGEGGPRLAGILVAAHTNGNGYATCIRHVLFALNLEEHLKCFKCIENQSPAFCSMQRSSFAYPICQTKQQQVVQNNKKEQSGVEMGEDVRQREIIIPELLRIENTNSKSKENIFQSERSNKLNNDQDCEQEADNLAYDEHSPMLLSVGNESLNERTPEDEQPSDACSSLRSNGSRYSGYSARCSNDSGYSTQTVSSQMSKRCVIL